MVRSGPDLCNRALRQHCADKWHRCRRDPIERGLTCRVDALMPLLAYRSNVA